MKLKLSFPLGWLSAGVALALALKLDAATLYVDASSANPVPPFTNWATAAKVIQEAVDAAASGDSVLVTNGVYAAGGRALDGTVTNRVAVDRPMTLRSVNGPDVTVIEGYQVPGVTNGDGAVRCAYLVSGAVLSGFTLRNGATRWLGNYVIEGGGGVWCQSSNAVVTNCTLIGNSCYGFGGGASGGTLNNCTLTGNSAPSGGGAYNATLNHCTLSSNVAWMPVVGLTRSGGGGACLGTLNNCILTGNSAQGDGGGAYAATLNNCTLIGNSCARYGGGASGTVRNCIIYYNTAMVGDPNFGGGSLEYSCTFPLPLTGSGNITNEPRFVSPANGDFHLQPESPCINSGNNASASATTDLDGNPRIIGSFVDIGPYEVQQLGKPFIAVQPAIQWVLATTNVTFTVGGRGLEPFSYQWLFQETAISDATNASLTLSAVTANDAGGYSVIVTNAFGSVTSSVASLIVWLEGINYVWQNSPNPMPPYTNWATAARTIQDAVDVAIPGVVVLVTNGVYATGGRPAAGSATANRVVVDKPLTIRSINGPGVTIIQGLKAPGAYQGVGPGAIRCVYLADGAVLDGFTLTNGATEDPWPWSPSDSSGGGVYCVSTNATVTNCVLIGNAAILGGGVHAGTLYNCTLSGNAAYSAGGVTYCTLYNCTLNSNTAWGGPGGGGAVSSTLYQCSLIGNAGTNGGGAKLSTLYGCTLSANIGFGTASRCTLYNCALTDNPFYAASDCTLYNCTLTANAAGAYSSKLYNCIVYYNTGTNYYPGDSDGFGVSTFNYCCTTPMPANGVGNITNAPSFVDQVGGDLRLQADSPCINAGNNAWMPTATDLDGRPRIVGTAVDLGAYEFQAPGSTISYAWLKQFSLPNDGSADTTDLDGDGHNNRQEWKAGTIPTNKLSVLRMMNPVTNAFGLGVSWQSVSDRSYFLERATNLGSLPAFNVIRSNLPGQAGTTSFTDSNAAGAGPFFYRVGVEE